MLNKKINNYRFQHQSPVAVEQSSKTRAQTSPSLILNLESLDKPTSTLRPAFTYDSVLGGDKKTQPPQQQQQKQQPQPPAQKEIAKNNNTNTNNTNISNNNNKPPTVLERKASGGGKRECIVVDETKCYSCKTAYDVKMSKGKVALWSCLLFCFFVFI